jgi:hypothetical protein
MCDIPKVNTSFGLLYDLMVGPLNFAETITNVNIYLEISELSAFPQTEDSLSKK